MVFGTTLTVKVQAFVLPDASIAVATTMVSPIGKTAPEGGTVVTAGVEQTSVAPGRSKVTIAPPDPAGDSPATISVGHEIAGGTVSTTLIACVQVAVLLQESVAVQVRVAVKVVAVTKFVSVPAI
jgi:hypothetical protein